jgi:DNA (cytosine-5)-methyltransferase 1
MYDSTSHTEQPLTAEAMDYIPPSIIEDYPTQDHTPLAMMDVFAGVGGLSLGIEASGVAKAKWAIGMMLIFKILITDLFQRFTFTFLELNEDAAQAYKINHPDCSVIVDDCNVVLKEAMDGKKVNEASGRRIPAKGEVDLLCGGPPCQGFSLLNSFTNRDASKFKNSLIRYAKPKF